MYNFNEIEENVLKFWKDKQIYQKLKKRNSRGKKFYFLQGPPYTSGKIHIGTAWNNCLKDQIMRYKRMQSFDVWDRNGFDMHGLPIENAVQKNLKIEDKKQIEGYGVEKFVRECRVLMFGIEMVLTCMDCPLKMQCKKTSRLRIKSRLRDMALKNL